MKTHKVGGDALFTRRQLHTMSMFRETREATTSRVFWFLTMLTASFFLSQSLLLFLG